MKVFTYLVSLVFTFLGFEYIDDIETYFGVAFLIVSYDLFVLARRTK